MFKTDNKEIIEIETENKSLPNSVLRLLEQNLTQQTDKQKQKEIKELIDKQKEKQQQTETNKNDFSKYLNSYYPIWFRYKDYENIRDNKREETIKQIRALKRKIVSIETDFSLRSKTKKRIVKRIKKQLFKLSDKMKVIEKVFDDQKNRLKKQLISETKNLKFKTYGFNSNLKELYKTYMSIEFENKPKITKRENRKRNFGLSEKMPYQLENYLREKKVLTELQQTQKRILKNKLETEKQNSKSYYNNDIVANYDYLNSILKQKIDLIELMYLNLILRQIEIYKQKKEIVIKTVKQLDFLKLVIPLEKRYLYNLQQISLILNKSKNQQKINQFVDYLTDLKFLGLSGFKIDFLKGFCFNEISKMKSNKIIQKLVNEKILVKQKLLRPLRDKRFGNETYYLFVGFNSETKTEMEKSFVLV